MRKHPFIFYTDRCKIRPQDLVVIMVVASAYLTACSNHIYVAPSPEIEKTTHSEEEFIPSMAYQIEPGIKDRDRLNQRFSVSQLELLEKLNRSDTNYITHLDTLVVPGFWSSDERIYSPLPLHYAGATSQAKLIVVCQSAQVFGGYEYGRLVRWGPISSGQRAFPTPTGLFHLNWKSEGRYSTIDPSWYLTWYFNFHNLEGLSFHAYALPGKPVSHACIRLLERDAQWLFKWGESWQIHNESGEIVKTGTPILIFDDYAFDSAPPWRSSEWLKGKVKLPEDPFEAF